MIKEYGYEFTSQPDEKILLYSKNKFANDLMWGAYCLRSGRDALKAIAREYKPTVVYIPALSCESMSLPFLMYNHKVIYYDLNRDFSVKSENLCSVIPKHETAILLYMDYFGNKAFDNEELINLKAMFPKLIFVEDITHTFDKRKKEFEADYTVLSLRKWINIPDGGLLWAKNRLNNDKFKENSTFFETRLYAQSLRKKFLETGEQSLKNEFRHIFSTVTEIIDKDKAPAKMSLYSFEVTRKTDLNKIREMRISNSNVILNKLKDVLFIQKDFSKSCLYTPIIIKNRNEIQRKLAVKGIFCTIIWPLNDEQKKISAFAEYVSENMLAIYCDQRYRNSDMTYMAEEILRLFNE